MVSVPRLGEAGTKFVAHAQLDIASVLDIIDLAFKIDLNNLARNTKRTLASA